MPTTALAGERGSCSSTFSMFEELPELAIAGLLFCAILLTMFTAHALGRKVARTEEALGSLEAMTSGLLGLLLAFDFNIAQNRFDARQQLIVREANAIGTAHLRCSALEADERRRCRELLRRYAELRIEAYDLYGVASEQRELAAILVQSDTLQSKLWSLVSSAAREKPDPTRALLLSAANDVIDRDADRRASLRITVPKTVSFAIIISCLAWASLIGYSSALKRTRSLLAWVLVSLLVCVVFGVALDLDRPHSGLITTSAAEVATTAVLRSMGASPD